MHVAHNRLKSSAIHWMGCPRTNEDVEEDVIPTVKSPLTSNSSHIHKNSHTNRIIAFTILYVYLVYIIKRDLII